MTVAEIKSAPKDQNVPFEAVLLVKSIATRKSKNGTNFLAIELGDKTGAFQVVSFQDNADYLFFEKLPEGSVVHVRGHTAYYQNRFSPKLEMIDAVREEDLGDAAANLVETAPIPASELWEELQTIIAEIKHPPLRATLEQALKEQGEAFRNSPAALAMHHAYRHGLIEHTVRCCRIARATLPLYPEVNADLAITGIILHDIGKCDEFSSGLSNQKTRAGLLQGHVVLGYRVARQAALKAKLEPDLLERLEHIILSHQGEPEWGAAVYAATPEAVFVSMVDNLDAKMGMVQYALRTAPEGVEFSERMPGLNAQLLLTPPLIAQQPEPTEADDQPDLFSTLEA